MSPLPANQHLMCSKNHLRLKDHNIVQNQIFKNTLFTPSVRLTREKKDWEGVIKVNFRRKKRELSQYISTERNKALEKYFVAK